MPKLSKEEKLKLVRRYIGGHYVPTPEGYRSRTAFKASLLAWAKRYRMYGEKGLERKAKTAAGALDKAEAVRRCLSGERNRDLAAEYGVSPGTVSNWCRAYSQSGTDLVKSIGERRLSPMPEKVEVGSEEFERLSDKEKLKVLREEYEYLRTEGSRKEKAEITYRLASQGYSLKRLLKALGLGKSTYEFHARRFREGSRKDPLKAKIEAVFSGNKGRYGVRRVTAALRRDGERVNHKKVQRIMHRLALKGKTCKKRRPYSSYRER